MADEIEGNEIVGAWAGKRHEVLPIAVTDDSVVITCNPIYYSALYYGLSMYMRHLRSCAPNANTRIPNLSLPNPSEMIEMYRVRRHTQQEGYVGTDPYLPRDEWSPP